MIDRHQIEHGQKAWAFINGAPTEILFRRLLPYNGFAYWLTTDTKETFAPPAFKDTEVGVTYELRSEREEHSEAIFAETREELIRDRIEKQSEKIRQAQQEQLRLMELLRGPLPEANKA